MFQEILALIVVFVAIVYLAWSLFRVFVPGKKGPKSMCSSCPAVKQGGCGIKSPHKL